MDAQFSLRNLLAGTNIKLIRPNPSIHTQSGTKSTSSSIQNSTKIPNTAHQHKNTNHNNKEEETKPKTSSLPKNKATIHSASVNNNTGKFVSDRYPKKSDDDTDDDDDDDDNDEVETEDEGTVSDATDSDENTDSDDDDNDDDTELALFKHTNKQSRTALTSSSSSSSLSTAASSSTLLEQQIHNFRQRMGIKVQGNNVPSPYSAFTEIPDNLTRSQTQDIALLRSYSFTSSSLNPTNTPNNITERIERYHTNVRNIVLENIELSAYKEPTPIQMQSLPSIFSNRDTLGYAPTGSGKTAAYLLPLLLRLQCHNYSIKGPRVLIIVPTKELASQIVREANRLSKGLGIKSIVLNKAVVTGTQGTRVSATMDVPELIHQKIKNNYKKNKGNKYHDRTGNENLRKRKHTEIESHKDSDGSMENEEEDDDDNNSDNNDDDDGDNDDDILRWTDDEDVPIITPSSSLKTSHTKSSSASSTSSSTQMGTIFSSTDESVHQIIPKLPYCDILVTTPLLFVSLLAHTQKQHATEKQCSPDNVSVILPSVFTVVFDEVDKLLETGFIEQVDKILEVTQSKQQHQITHSSSIPPQSRSHPLSSTNSNGILPHRVQYCMFTATLPSGIEELISTVLTNPVKIFVGVRGSVVTSVQQKLVFVGREDGKLLALRDMIKTGVKTPALIFTQSKDRANQVYHSLQLDNLRVGVIHADCTDQERETRIQQFRRGQLLFLVTTDLLGRGLDFKGVNMVINFDLPQSGISYIHRIGRTGRAGRQGEAVTFFTEEDILHLRTIANVMRISGCEVPEWMLTIKKLDRKERKRFEQRVPYRSTVGPRHSVTEGGRKDRRKKQRKTHGKDAKFSQTKKERNHPRASGNVHNDNHGYDHDTNEE